jgi:hypothetical protein
MLAGIVALASGLAPSLADAAPVERVAVSPLTVDGELPRQSVQLLEQHLIERMREAGFDVVDPKASASDGANVLRVTVRVKQRDYVLEAELYGADGSQVLVRADDECDLCGIEEAADRLAGLADSIWRELEADARARPMLGVTTTPAGAIVFVDGKRLGVTPLELELEPGRHEVRVAKEGFAPREREVELVKGVDASMKVELVPVTPMQIDAPERPKVAGWLGWTLLGTGAATTVVGVTLLALHGQPIRSKCTGGNVDMDGTCRFVHDSLVPGAVLGAAGLGLLSSGIALIFTRKKRLEATRKAALVPSAGGVSMRF